MTETFPIVPSQVRLLWVVVPLIVVLLGVAGALGYTLSAGHTARFEVSPSGLRLRGDFYGRTIPPADLQPEAARAIDLRAERALSRWSAQEERRSQATRLVGSDFETGSARCSTSRI